MTDKIPTRTIAEAMQQRESQQMDALETLIEAAMEEVAEQAAGQNLDAVQKMLADRLRPHLPVDAPSNKTWLRERAKMILAAL